jgi:hypothetical protein
MVSSIQRVISLNLGEIEKDSLKYPLSDWKKILILGILVILSNMVIINSVNVMLSAINVLIIYFLIIIGEIIFLFVRGYFIRIIKSSVAGVVGLPEFNSWVGMMIDGIKFFLVNAVYLIPAILLIGFGAVLTSNLGIIGSNPSSFPVDLILASGIWGLVAILYTVIIIPLLLMAIVNMVYNDGEFSAAFRFREILSKISSIGGIRLIVWYIMTGIIFVIIAFIGIFLFAILFVNPIIGQILILLVLFPYLLMYFARSVALFYKSSLNRFDDGVCS